MSRVAISRQTIESVSGKTDRATDRTSTKSDTGYLASSAGPLTSLIFLIPMMVAYEIGTRWYAIDPVSHAEQRIIAFNWIESFFSLFGGSGRYIPPAAVVSILLACHLAHGDRWSARLTVLLLMVLECAMYTVPLLGLGYLFDHCLLMHGPDENWRSWLVLSIGAGVYEELIFRLAMFSALSFILIDLLKVPRGRALPLIVVISAVSFSYYHYCGYETFHWPSFFFRSLAGIYFGIIFLVRGFGLTSGSHIAYDITVVLLR